VSLERGFEEMAAMRFVIGPVWRLLERVAAAEQAWIDWLGAKRASVNRSVRDSFPNRSDGDRR
jgi:hypothetical protein